MPKQLPTKNVKSLKLAKLVLVLGFFTFLSASIFGMSQSVMGMEMKDDGTMSGCPFTGMEEFCTMTFTEHLTRWQSMFTSIPVKSSTLSLLVLAFALLFFTSGFLERYFIWAVERLAALQRLYLIHHPHLSLFNPLREAFSQGILNPKIY